jgi:REP element-mobilizing transposase RayT
MHDRRSVRLKGWDYSADGTYFITVCTHDRTHLFGEIVDGKMRRSPAGELVAATWQWLSTQYSYVRLDEWCVMPNHLHGILILAGGEQSTRRKTVGRLIGAFKTVSTKQINESRDTPGAVVWQRNFWERIVREYPELEGVREYIRNNPANWPTDSLRCP